MANVALVMQTTTGWRPNARGSTRHQTTARCRDDLTGHQHAPWMSTMTHGLRSQARPTAAPLTGLVLEIVVLVLLVSIDYRRKTPGRAIPLLGTPLNATTRAIRAHIPATGPSPTAEGATATASTCHRRPRDVAATTVTATATAAVANAHLGSGPHPTPEHGRERGRPALSPSPAAPSRPRCPTWTLSSWAWSGRRGGRRTRPRRRSLQLRGDR